MLYLSNIHVLDIGSNQSNDILEKFVVALHVVLHGVIYRCMGLVYFMH